MREQAREAGWSGDAIQRLAIVDGVPLRVDFVAERCLCADCRCPLSPYKSQTRQLVTLAAGTVQAREIQKRCRMCLSAPAGSRQLAALAPAGQRFGYDLIVAVGLARYHRHLQREEIQDELARQGIALSTGSISALCDRFLLAIEALHWQRAEALRAAMPHRYPLHIDATCDNGRGGLFVCLDGWTGWVLHAVRIRSEQESELRPAIELTTQVFGDPVALVRDLGSGVAKAVSFLRERSIPDLLCHYHFLRAVGEKLCDDDHSLLRHRIARSKLRSRLRDLLRANRPSPDGRLPDGLREDLPALLLWLLEGEARKQARYPFSLAHLDLHLRCQQFEQELDRRLPRPRSDRELRLIRQVREAFDRFRLTDPEALLANRLQRARAAFNELRCVLRVSDRDLPGGSDPAKTSPGPARDAACLPLIADDLQQYRFRLQCRLADPPAADSHDHASIILSYLDTYGGQLGGQPVVRDSDGSPVAVVARTNNACEHFFSEAKRHLRRRLGRARLGRDLEDQPAQTALAANLLDPNYVRIVCGTLGDLPAALAAIEHQPNPSNLQRNNRDASLRKRNRAWAATTTPKLPLIPPTCHPQAPAHTAP